MKLRYPAEWEPHWGTLLAWPRAQSDWQPWLSAIRDEYLAFADTILQFERLMILCPDDATAHDLRARLEPRADHELITLVHPYDDTWIRDYGPQGAYRNARLQLIDFAYNAWGGKYDFETDDQVCRGIYERGLWPTPDFHRTDALTLEGGALETDGQGTLLVRSQTLHDPQRNPGLSRADIETELAQSLGIERVLWLESGHLSGDDTDGHIDTLARFAAPDHIVYQPADQNDALGAALAELKNDESQPYALTALPVAAPVKNAQGEPLPASYANYLHVAGALLVPAYDQPTDALACDVLANAFPDKQVISCPARTLIEQFGSLHCATLHIPALTSTTS